MLNVVGLILAFVMVILFSNRATRQCRWREDRTRLRDGLVLHRCAVCGAERYGAAGKPPKTCLKT